MNCEIISIGDELLLGDTINTNAAWLGQVLTARGIEIQRVYTIGDEPSLLKKLVRKAMDRSGLVITTGGLGPTHDDITKEAVAELFDADMVLHVPTLNYIKKIFEQRNLPFSQSNYHQAEVPDNCDVLFNKQGTAPGLWFEEDGSRLVVLPGIPREMQSLVQHHVLPKIDSLTKNNKRTFSYYIKVAGIGESTLSDEVIGPLDTFLNNDVKAAYLPSLLENTIRISVRAHSEAKAAEKAQSVKEYIYSRAGDFIIGEGEKLTLPEAMGNVLRNHRYSISIAESCTGGAVADLITNVAGCSAYMRGGIIAYDNEVKSRLLGVSSENLRKHGAVSLSTALQMAQGAASALQADIGIATTGIAGPGGGTKQKPVGTVWIGFWSANHHFALHTQLTNERIMNKQRTAAIALEMVRRTLSGIGTMPYDLKPHRA